MSVTALVSREWLRELRRPWKLITLVLGIAVLVAGAFWFDAPDWDIPISFIMAALAYLTAPWSMRVVVTRQWKWLVLALFWTWFTVDGCYWLYWSWKDPHALELMRSANFGASLVLYATCGLLWYWRGSLHDAWIASRQW